MLSLDNQDATCRFEHARIRDVLSCAQVRRDTNTFKHTSGGQEASHIRDSAEVVCAGGNRLVSKCFGQQGDVRSFISADRVDLVSNRCVVASVLKVRSRQLGERLVVKFGFQMLERQCVLEDLRIVESGASTSGRKDTASRAGRECGSSR